MLMNPHSCEYEFVFTAAGAVTLIPLMFAASVISSGSGQLRSAAWKHFIVARTVDAATPFRRAISRIDTPPTNFNRRTSRTWRMIVLSAGIRVSPLEQPKEPDLSRPAEAPATPGDIIPEWWATS